MSENIRKWIASALDRFNFRPSLTSCGTDSLCEYRECAKLIFVHVIFAS